MNTKIKLAVWALLVIESGEPSILEVYPNEKRAHARRREIIQHYGLIRVQRLQIDFTLDLARVMDQIVKKRRERDAAVSRYVGEGDPVDIE